jgi:hypothetical protein
MRKLEEDPAYDGPGISAICPNCEREVFGGGILKGDYDAYPLGESCLFLAAGLLVIAPLVLSLFLHWPWLWAVGAPWAAFLVIGPIYYWLVTRR